MSLCHSTTTPHPSPVVIPGGRGAKVALLPADEAEVRQLASVKERARGRLAGECASVRAAPHSLHCVHLMRCASATRPTALRAVPDPRALTTGAATASFLSELSELTDAVGPVSYTHLTLPTICSV